MTINEKFGRFQYFNFETSFWKTKISFNKTGVLFLVESTTIERETFPYKTALSEANVKTNRMGFTKGPIAKNGVFPATTLSFWKFCFSVRTFEKILIWCTDYTIVHIHTSCKRWIFIWGGFLPAIILIIDLNAFTFTNKTAGDWLFKSPICVN